MAMARWRTGNRWRIEAEYFQMNRTGNKTIDRTINWGDQTFPVNSTVSSKFDFSDLRLSAGYSFFRTKDKEVGVGLGAHVAKYDASLSGSFNGAPLAGESEKITAPLPVLSFYGQFALTDRWAVAGRMDRLASGSARARSRSRCQRRTRAGRRSSSRPSRVRCCTRM
jgi:hypothetical protein